MGKWKEGDVKGEGRKGSEGRIPVPDCESAKVATLKCGGPPTMPEENRGPWSKKSLKTAALESYSDPPDPLAGFKGAYF